MSRYSSAHEEGNSIERDVESEVFVLRTWCLYCVFWGLV